MFVVYVEVLVWCLLVELEVVLIGFGVCDLLCLEVGLCFYGYDMDSVIMLVEVSFGWVIFKVCCVDGVCVGGFFGVEWIFV